MRDLWEVRIILTNNNFSFICATGYVEFIFQYYRLNSVLSIFQIDFSYKLYGIHVSLKNNSDPRSIDKIARVDV